MSQLIRFYVKYLYIVTSYTCMHIYLLKLEDTCNYKIIVWGRYITGYIVNKFSFTGRAVGAVKRDFLPYIRISYIRRNTSKNENFENGYPQSNALLQYDFKLERCDPYKSTHHPTKCDIIYDVKPFPKYSVFFDIFQSDVTLQSQVYLK